MRSCLPPSAPPRSNIGDGGNKEGPDKKYYPQPRYSAYREPSFGHGTLDLLDGTRAGGCGRVWMGVRDGSVWVGVWMAVGVDGCGASCWTSRRWLSATGAGCRCAGRVWG